MSGHLYEYSARGAKLLHSSGKYNNVYSGTDLRGGGTGEESLDLLLVTHNRHRFPLHPDRKGDERDYRRRGSLKNLPDQTRAKNNKSGDSFGQFAFDDYYGPGSRWTRRIVLTREGYLVVADEYAAGKALGADYVAGPVWHLAVSGESDEATEWSTQSENWFDAPAFAHAWWQKEKLRLFLYLHQDAAMKFGTVRQQHSQDTDPNITCFGWRSIRHGISERFLSVLVPHTLPETPNAIASMIETQVTDSNGYNAQIQGTNIHIRPNGNWTVVRN